jgi:hypothetical protein
VAVVSDLLLEESASGGAQEGFVNEKQIDMEPCSMNHHSSMICKVNFSVAECYPQSCFCSQG